MKKSRISVEKVAVYKERLHSLLTSILADKENFVGTKWTRIIKASNHFIPACKNLGYITIHNKSRKHPIYTIKLAPTSVEPVHGKNVYEEVSRLAGERHKKPEETVVSVPQDDSPMKHYNDAELVAELKRRGYSGTLTRSETLNI